MFDWASTPLTIWYAAAAPGLIDGVFQLNVQLAPDAPSSYTSAALTLKGAVGSLSSNAVQLYVK